MTLKHIAAEASDISAYANEIEGELAPCVARLADLVEKLAQGLDETQETAARAANVASCLANGIQPD